MENWGYNPLENSHVEPPKTGGGWKMIFRNSTLVSAFCFREGSLPRRTFTLCWCKSQKGDHLKRLRPWRHHGLRGELLVLVCFLRGVTTSSPASERSRSRVPARKLTTVSPWKCSAFLLRIVSKHVSGFLFAVGFTECCCIESFVEVVQWICFLLVEGLIGGCRWHITNQLGSECTTYIPGNVLGFWEVINGWKPWTLQPVGTWCYT